MEKQAGRTQGHTPGPWALGKNGDNCAKDHAICSDARVIAKVYGNGYPVGSGWSPDSAADARLIAAAPDLLAALERFAHAMEQKSYPELQGVASDAFAALARAKGEA